MLSCKLAEAEAARSFAEQEAARARGAAAQLEAWGDMERYGEI